MSVEVIKRGVGCVCVREKKTERRYSHSICGVAPCRIGKGGSNLGDRNQRRKARTVYVHAFTQTFGCVFGIVRRVCLCVAL